ncbi:hypothetical protein GF345_01715 [Candidatus Woesearchaeota archaeon]|nr:hypothetical protein [Candidatus Woesearchaeota archaeon]
MRFKTLYPLTAVLLVIIVYPLSAYFRYQSLKYLEGFLMSDFLRVSAMIFISDIILAAGLGIVSAYIITKPLSEIRDKIIRISKGDIGVSVEDSRIREMHDLVMSLKRSVVSFKLYILRKKDTGKKELSDGKKAAKNKIKEKRWFISISLLTIISYIILALFIIAVSFLHRFYYIRGLTGFSSQGFLMSSILQNIPTMLIIILIASIISSRLSKAVRNVTEKMRIITKGNFDVDLTKTGIGEVDMLVDSLKPMVSQLKKASRS